MRKSGRILPRVLVMARSAGRAELARVRIFMATGASGFQPRENSIQIASFQYCPILWRDIFFRVALRAFELRVLAFELPAGLVVIEPLLRHGPPDDPPGAAGVFGMAPATIVSSKIRLGLRRMIAALFRESSPNFLVTLHAAQLRASSTERVAFDALQRTIEVAMRVAKRARGDLGNELGS